MDLLNKYASSSDNEESGPEKEQKQIDTSASA